MINKRPIISISIICLILLVAIIFLNILFPPPITKYNMEKIFLKDKENIISITNYLENQEYSDIYITSTSNKGEMFASAKAHQVGENVNITDNLITENIDTLFKRHNYQVIVKERNGIYFQRWSNRSYGRGVVYSTNGESPQNELLTILEPLTEKNWYFYEEK